MGTIQIGGDKVRLRSNPCAIQALSTTTRLAHWTQNRGEPERGKSGFCITMRWRRRCKEEVLK